MGDFDESSSEGAYEDFSQEDLSEDDSEESCEGFARTFTDFDNENNIESLDEQKILSAKEVFKIMETKIKNVCELTNITPTKARILLSYFKWDSEKLADDIFSGDEMAKKLTLDSWKFVPCDIRNSLDCEICFDTIVNSEDICKLPCNQRFCNSCLTSYVTTQIQDLGGLLHQSIKCPGSQCELDLEDSLVLKMLKSSSLSSKYQQIIAESFVKSNQLIKWCPNAGCENAICLEPGFRCQLQESVRCSCGFWFCFECHANSHDPVPCEMLTLWSKVKSEDLEAQEWILRHTKPCPGCKAQIEKNGGCMHMTCSKCRHEWCWVCMELWRHHHNCPRVETSAEPAMGAQFLGVRRFANYHTLYETMRQAYDLDVAQYKHKLGKEMEIELNNNCFRIHFVAEAVEILLQSRRTLMHSYVFSFFMTTLDNQMFIFEENLSFLERCTEQLSEVLENDVTSQTVTSLRQKIIDATKMCTKRRRDLMDHIIEGNDKRWWRKFPIPSDELIAAEQAAGEEAIQRLIY